MSYEHSNFSISQCTFNDNSQEDIIPIHSGSAQDQSTRDDKAIIGGSLGAVAILLLGLAVLLFMRHKYQRRRIPIRPKLSTPPGLLSSTMSAPGMSPNEMGDNSIAEVRTLSPEIDGTAVAELGQASMSSLLFRNGYDRRRPLMRQCAATARKPSNEQLAIRGSDRGRTWRFKHNRRGQIYERTPALAAISDKHGTSLLNRPLPLLPRNSTLSVIQADVRDEGLEDLEEKLAHRMMENPIRTGTPF